MERKINLRQLEKDTAAVVFQTGIVDIGIGLILLVVGMAMIFDDIRYYIDMGLVVPPLFIVLVKRYVIDPRMGVVAFSKKRVRRSTIMIATITIFLLVSVSFTFFGGPDVGADIINPRWIITFIIFGICVAIAYFLEYHRMYLYALLFAGAFNLSEYLREHPEIIAENGVAYLLAATIMIIIGTYFLVKFLREYPLSEEIG